MKEIKIFNDPKAFEIAADKTRRRIIHLLRARELSVAQIASALEMTPQAIYHHVKRMLEVGLIEVAKEERVNHFIETYYQAAAEVFQFNYDVVKDREYTESRFREVLRALDKIGLTKLFDADAVSRASSTQSRRNEIWRECSAEAGEKISGLDELDGFGKQDAIELACYASMRDEQFEEWQRLEREIRDLIRQHLIHQ
jgi:DNA-binding transcriptional ArsR family regulator